MVGTLISWKRASSSSYKAFWILVVIVRDLLCGSHSLDSLKVLTSTMHNRVVYMSSIVAGGFATIAILPAQGLSTVYSVRYRRFMWFYTTLDPCNPKS